MIVFGVSFVLRRHGEGLLESNNFKLKVTLARDKAQSFFGDSSLCRSQLFWRQLKSELCTLW